MADLLLTWFGAALFALLIAWGMDAQLQRKPRVIFWFVGLIVVFNLFAQTAFFSTDKGLSSALDGGPITHQSADDLRDVLSSLALIPGELRGTDAPREWLKILTSTMIHYGWIPLFFNLWFIVLFGHVLEGMLGWIRFVPIMLLGLVVPAALEGFLPPIPGASADHFHGGASGLVYTFIGAGLIVFPRAYASVALNYDGRFWAITLCILLPITTLTARAGLPLTQMIILVGMVGSFLFFLPICRHFQVPIWGIVLYKLFQDMLLVEPLKHDIISNSIWRIGGGLLVGMMAGVMLDGVRGFRRTWHELKPKKRGHGATLPSLKKLEAAAHIDAETAKRYLGQRVFVSDAESIINFYNEVVIPKYPELVLPEREQLSLARLLQSKGRDAEALHAYENLLENYEINEDHWNAWLTTAELLRKVNPERREDIRDYLEKFLESNDIMMRDRLEARHILQDMDKETAEAEAAEAPELEEDNAALDQTEETTEPETYGEDPAPKEEATPGVYAVSDPDNKVESGDNVSAEIETIKLPSIDSQEQPSVDFPRLKPRTFEVVDGEPIGEAVRDKSRVSSQTWSDEIAETYWKPIEMKSGFKLDDERLLVIKTRGNRKVAPAQSSGHYSGADVREGAPEKLRRGGRLAHIEAIKKDFHPNPAPSASTDATPNKIPSNYGVGDIEGDRPRIRLRNEKDAR